MNIIFFRRPKPRPFNYRPIYYDEEKEAAKDRKKALEGLQSKDPSERLRAEIRRKWRTEGKDTDKKYKMFRIFFILIICGFAIYLIFFTNFVDRFVSLFVR